ncbi:MAG: DUF4199 domain-containing protein [Saprospirales bacterium]|nr:DUF4199 domain-containing protein [Saprospirales bacterium]
MQKYKTELKWAIIFTVATLLWMVFEKAMGWHDVAIADHPKYTNLFIFIPVVIYALGMVEHRKKLGGLMTWKQGFMFGMRVTVIVVLLAPLAQWLTHTFITPDYFQNAINYAVEHNIAPKEQLEAYFNLKSYIVQSVLMGLVMGAFTSAVVALIFRRK